MKTANTNYQKQHTRIGWAQQIANEYADRVRVEHNPDSAVLAAIRHAVFYGATEMIGTLKLQGELK